MNGQSQGVHIGKRKWAFLKRGCNLQGFGELLNRCFHVVVGDSGARIRNPALWRQLGPCSPSERVLEIGGLADNEECMP